MQFTAILCLFMICIASMVAVPIADGTVRDKRQASVSEKRQQKARAGYIRFGKRRVDPNAELLYLDQLLL